MSGFGGLFGHAYSQPARQTERERDIYIYIYMFGTPASDLYSSVRMSSTRRSTYLRCSNLRSLVDGVTFAV